MRTPKQKLRLTGSSDANRKSIELSRYPQLADIVWSRAVSRIPEDEAFALYERNWRFVDVSRLTAAERKFIGRLARKYGKGIVHANVSPSLSPARW